MTRQIMVLSCCAVSCVIAFDVQLNCFDSSSCGLDLSAVKAVDSLITKCKAAVTAHTKSAVRSHELKTNQLNLEMKTNKLVRDVATRWGSKYDLLQSVHTNLPALLAGHLYTFELDVAERWLLDDLLMILKPLREASVRLHGNSLTLSDLPVVWASLIGQLQCMRYVAPPAAADIGSAAPYSPQAQQF